MQNVFDSTGEIIGFKNNRIFNTKMDKIFYAYNAISLDDNVVDQIHDTDEVRILHKGKILVCQTDEFRFRFFRPDQSFLERNPHISAAQRLVPVEIFKELQKEVLNENLKQRN